MMEENAKSEIERFYETINAPSIMLRKFTEVNCQFNNIIDGDG